MTASGPAPTRRSGARPLAVFIAGPPASGKSTLGTDLAPALGAALLDLDVATGPLTGLVLNLIGAVDLSESRAAQLTREPRYETLFSLAEDTTRAGTSTVLVAPFTAERDAHRWDVVARRFAKLANVHLVWLTLPPAELASRLTARAAHRDALKQHDPSAYVADLAEQPPSAPHLLLNADRPVQDLVQDVLVHLKR